MGCHFYCIKKRNDSWNWKILKIYTYIFESYTADDDQWNDLTITGGEFKHKSQKRTDKINLMIG